MGGRVSRQRVGDQQGEGQQQQDGCNEAGGVINNTISIVPYSPSSNVLVATTEGREGQVGQTRSPPQLTSPASSGGGSPKGRSVRSRSFSHSPNERIRRTRHPDDNASTQAAAAPWYSCCASATDDETIAMPHSPGAGTRGASMTQRTNGMSEMSEQHHAPSGSPLRNGREFALTRKLSVDTADAFSPQSTHQLPHTLTSPSPPPIRIVRARSQSGDFTLGAMKLAYLRASILGQLLTDPELFSFADDCDLRTFEKGQVIYAQGQSIVGAGQESCLYLMCCGTADVEVETRGGGGVMNHTHHSSNTSQQLLPPQPSSPFLTPTAHGPSFSLNEASLLHSTRARQASLAAARHLLDTNMPTNANAPASASPSASNLPPNLPRRPSASTPGSRRPSLTGSGLPPSAATTNMIEDHLSAVASAITPPASTPLAPMKRRNSLSPSPSPCLAPTTPVQDHLQHQQHQLQLQQQQQPYRSRIGSIPTTTTLPHSNQDSMASTRRNSTRLQSSFLSTGTPKGMGSETPMVASVRGNSSTTTSDMLTVAPTASNTTTNSFRSSATSSTRTVPSTTPLRPRTLKQPVAMSHMNLDEGPFLSVNAATCAGMQSSTSTWNQKTSSLQQQQQQHSSNSPYSSSPPSPRATLPHSAMSTAAAAPQPQQLLPQTHRLGTYRHGCIFGLETAWIIPSPLTTASSNDSMDATKSHLPPPRRLTLPPVLKSHHSSSSSVTFSPALPLLPSSSVAASPPTITSALPRSTRTLSVEVSEREESRVGQEDREMEHSRNGLNQEPQVQLQNKKAHHPSNLSDHPSLAPPTTATTPSSFQPPDNNKINSRLSSVIASSPCTCLTITQQKLNAFFSQHPTTYESVTMCFGANLLSTSATTGTPAASSFNSHPFLSSLSHSNRALLITLMNPLRLTDALGKVLFEEGSGGGCSATIAQDEALYYTILQGDIRLTIPTRGSATTRGSIMGGGSGSRDFTPTNRAASIAAHLPPSPKLLPAPTAAPATSTTPMLVPMSTPMPTRSLTLSSQPISSPATSRFTSGGSFIFNGAPSSNGGGIIDKDLTVGQWFGELSPLLQIKRTGTATINSPSQCALLTIEKHTLHSFMNMFPETWHAFFQTISNPNGSGNANNNNNTLTPTASSLSSSSSSTPLLLSNIFLLHLPLIQDHFYRFCEKEHSCENLEFVRACEEFKVKFKAAELVMEKKEQVKKGRKKSDVVEEQALDNLPGMTASTGDSATLPSPPPRPLSANSSSLLLSHARSLYDQYISPSAPSQVNLRSIVTNILRLKLASGVIVSDMFTMASDEIIALMCADSFTRFRKSDMFVQALEKMSQQKEEQQVEGEQDTTDTVNALPSLKPPSGTNSKTSSLNASTCNTPKHQPLQHPSQQQQLPPRSPITRTPSAPPLLGSPSSSASIAAVTFASPAIVAVEYIDVKDLPNKLGSNELREYDEILKKRRESINLSSGNILGSSPLSSHSIVPHHLAHLESFELSNLPPLPALPNSRSPSHNSRMLTPLAELTRGSGAKKKSSNAAAAVGQAPSSQQVPTIEPQLSSYPSSQMYATHNKLHELQKQSDSPTSATAAFTPALPTESTSPTAATATSPRIIISPRRITIPLRRADSTPTATPEGPSTNALTITPKLMTPTAVSVVTVAMTDADY